MSSSQGGRVKIGGESTKGVISAGYVYDQDVLRDSSDWTRQLREKRSYNSYSTTNTGNKDTGGDPWFKYGNQFRLSYSYGKFMCEPLCGGNPFLSAVGDTYTAPPLPSIPEGAIVLTNCSTSNIATNTSGQYGTYTTSAVLAFQATSLTSSYTITYSGINGALRRVLSTSTASTYVDDTITSYSSGDSITLNYGDIVYFMPASDNGLTLTVNICKS